MWSELSVLGYLYNLESYSDRKKTRNLRTKVQTKTEVRNFPLSVHLYV